MAAQRLHARSLQQGVLNVLVLDLLEITGSLRHLRLACRAHRLEDGHLRIATDALHQPLLAQLKGVLQVPPRFHGAAAAPAAQRGRPREGGGPPHLP